MYKTLLIALIGLLGFNEAYATKILYDRNGKQAMEEVGKNGQVFFADILWDERVDGPFPADKEKDVGGLVLDIKNGKKDLKVDSQKKKDYDDAVAAKEAEKAAKQSEKVALENEKAALLAKLEAGNADDAEVQRALAILLKGK